MIFRWDFRKQLKASDEIVNFAWKALSKLLNLPIKVQCQTDVEMSRDFQLKFGTTFNWFDAMIFIWFNEYVNDDLIYILRFRNDLLSKVSRCDQMWQWLHICMEQRQRIDTNFFKLQNALRQLQNWICFRIFRTMCWIYNSSTSAYSSKVLGLS